MTLLEHYRLTKNPKGTVEMLIVIAEVYTEQGERWKAADAYRSVASIHAGFKHARLAEEFNQRAAPGGAGDRDVHRDHPGTGDAF